MLFAPTLCGCYEIIGLDDREKPGNPGDRNPLSTGNKSR